MLYLISGCNGLSVSSEYDGPMMFLSHSCCINGLSLLMFASVVCFTGCDGLIKAWECVNFSVSAGVKSWYVLTVRIGRSVVNL